MNFIDRALAQGDAVTEDGFLQAMADIYKEPQVWAELDRYPLYIGDVIHLIDYDTELQMEGLDSVVTGRQYERVLQALERCGALGEADILRRAGECSDRGPDEEEQLDALSRQLALHQDYAGFWDLVRAYIGRERRSGSAGQTGKGEEQHGGPQRTPGAGESGVPGPGD